MRPSLSSGALSVLTAIIVPIVANWTSILKKVPFYDYFFGPNGTVTDLQVVTGVGKSMPLNVAVTNEQFIHSISIIGGAVLGVTILFIAIKLIMLLVNSASMTFKELTAAETPAKRAVERELGRRISIRAIVLAIWVLYTLLFVKAILPFAILASQIGLVEDRPISTGIYYMMFAGLLIFFSTHVHVIMARLFLLRPRIFGGRELIVG